MHLTVLASDLDGTLAENGHVSPETWDALQAAKAAHLTLILVTGRTLASFTPEGPFAELFDAIVAEDGAVVYFPRQDVVVLPFGRLPTALIARIDAMPLPLDHGMALIATHVPFDEPILAALRDCGGGATIEYNRGAVMVLPLGATKGTGLAYALRELGLSARNVVACGDAENDRSLLTQVELAVAVDNATPALKEMADLVLPEPAGAGMRGLIRDLIAGRIGNRTVRPEQQLSLGWRNDQTPFRIDAWDLIDGVWGIAGDSASGKSWLGGLIAEEVMLQGYQAVIIDPEGDYRSLAALPHTMLVGGRDTQLQRVGDVITLCEYARCNLIIDLSWMPIIDRNAFTERLLRALLDLRTRCGRPHWLLIDEIQQSYADWASPFTGTVEDLMRGGGVTVVSYHPSQVAPAILQAVRVWALTRTTTPEDLASFDTLLSANPDWAEVRAHLPTLVRGHARLITPGIESDTCTRNDIVFRAGTRRVPHIRHLHKYVSVPLPSDKWFVFRNMSGTVCGTAANLSEFRTAIDRVPLASLTYHLIRGDFTRWLADTLHDTELSRQITKIAHHHPDGDALRAELRKIVAARYEDLAAML
ncbi:MAG: HAD hydrolase family protein [Chloroflexales bacterium]